MKKYKILLFDLDDTLVDDEANIRHAIKKLLQEYNYPSEEEDIKRWIEMDKLFWINRQRVEAKNPTKINSQLEKDQLTEKLRSKRFLLYFNFKISLEEAIELNDKYNEYLCECIVQIERASNIIEQLSINYKIQIITNSPIKAAINKLEKINCCSFIEKIYSAETLGFMKPKSEFISFVQSDINNFNNNDYLIIGDSLKSDIKLGMNSNIDTCWINFNKEKLDKDYKPTYIVNNLKELLEIL